MDRESTPEQRRKAMSALDESNKIRVRQEALYASEKDAIQKIKISNGIVTVIDRSIDIIEELVRLIPEILGETVNSKRRDLEEQLEELRDVAGQIVESLDKLREDTELSDKERIKLQKLLADDIRRYVYLSQERIKRTYEKLRYIIKTDRSRKLCDLADQDFLPEYPKCEIITIYTDPDSGIDMKLLTKLLKKPLGDFAIFLRWLRNRLPWFSCYGSFYAPNLSNGRCPSAINFVDRLPIIPVKSSVSPTTCPDFQELNSEYSSGGDY